MLLTNALVDVIFIPPAVPTVNTTWLCLSSKTAGHMADIGRLPGSIKLAGEGQGSSPTGGPGWEKSDISSL